MIVVRRCSDNRKRIRGALRERSRVILHARSPPNDRNTVAPKDKNATRRLCPVPRAFMTFKWPFYISLPLYTPAFVRVITLKIHVYSSRIRPLAWAIFQSASSRHGCKSEKCERTIEPPRNLNVHKIDNMVLRKLYRINDFWLIANGSIKYKTQIVRTKRSSSVISVVVVSRYRVRGGIDI